MKTNKRQLLKQSHDEGEASLESSIAKRLVDILRRLNNGEKLSPSQLATEYDVSLRTINRDLKDRFAFLELEKTKGSYSLSAYLLGKLTFSDLKRFATLAGISGVYPDLSHDFLKSLLTSQLESALLVKPQSTENVSHKTALFTQIENAIQNRRLVSFTYQKIISNGTGNSQIKTYQNLHPYKLVSQHGVWYVAALDGSVMKSFSFNQISDLKILEQHYPINAQLLEQLQNEDSIWLNQNKTQVQMLIAAEVAGYFKRRPLVAGQEIEKQNPDGSLVVNCKIAHPNQILPIIRYWLPHIRIVEPSHLQIELEAGLRGYLGSLTSSLPNT